MKKYNKQLYYRKKVDGIKYSKNPPGTFDVGRALAGRDCWQSPNLVEGDHPKTLLITDMSFGDLGHEQQFKKHLSDLLDQGFEIYIARSGYYKQITRNSLSDVTNQYLMSINTLFPTPEIAKKVAMEQLQLAEDKIFMIEDYKVLMSVDELADKPKLIKLDNKNQAELDQLQIVERVGVLTNKTEGYLPFIGTHIDQIDELIVRCGGLSRETAEKLLTYSAKVKKLQFTLIDHDFCALIASKSDLFANVEELTLLMGKISPPELLVLLSKMPNLKKLTVLDCRDLDNDSEAVKAELKKMIVDLSQLESFSVSNTQFSPVLKRVIASALKNAEGKSQLEYYHQGKCDADCISSVEGDLPLKAMVCGGSSPHRVLKTFDKFKQLESLDIEETLGTKDFLRMLSEDLDLSVPILEQLDIAKGLLAELPELKLLVVSSNLETTLLLAGTAPKLDTIVLRMANSTPQDMPIEPLPSLKSLFIFCSNVGAPPLKHLEKLLKAAPNLESILIIDDDRSPELLESIMLISKKYPHVIFSINGDCIRNEVLIYSNNLMQAKTEQEQKAKKDRLQTPVDAKTVFDARKHVESKPKKAPFVFEGKSGFHQGAVIERLCQYLILKNSSHQRIIPKIQDGICWSLSSLFSDIGSEALTQLVAKVVAWEGKELPDNNVQQLLDQVLDYVNRFQLGDEKPHHYYLGDSFKDLLKVSSPPFVITNAWHAIAIQKEKDEWVCYDPNYAKGVFRAKNENELIAEVEKRLGKSLFIANKKCDLKPAIKNPDEFLENGGILALDHASNQDDIIECLQGYIPNRKSLDGLMLRDIDGYPAWLVGLRSYNHEVRQITSELLKHYIKLNHQYANAISKSLEALSGEVQNEGIELFTAVHDVAVSIDKSEKKLDKQKLDEQKVDGPSTSKNEKPHNKPISDIKSKAYFNQFKDYFKAEAKSTEEIFTVDEYARSIVRSGGTHKKILVGLTDSAHVQSLAIALERYCHSTSTPLFYINSVEDLSMTAPTVKRQVDNSGVIVQGPGGGLYDYLQRCREKNEKAALVVNYDRFTADDIVRFNGMLDPARQIDGITIPANVQIIGLTNTKSPDCYQGSDFYSRFDLVDHCGLHPHRFQQVSLFGEQAADSDPYVIDLYQQNNWQQMLLGRWRLNGDQLVFEPGLLERAILVNKPLQIKNGPWDDPDFTHFWQRAKMYGYVEVPGKLIPIPHNLVITRRDDIQQQLWLQHIHISNGLSAKDVPVLNPLLLNQFYQQYEFDAQGLTLKTKEGIIEQHAGKTLVVNLTRNIPDNEWARLIDECQQYKVTLEVHCASDIVLSPRLAEMRAASPMTSALKLNKTYTIVTNDIDVSVDNLKESHPADWMVIDISECRSADLMKAINAKLKGSHFEFNEQENVLLRALKENKSIVLKGRFSKELSDALAPVLLERSRSNSPGQLALLTESAEAFDYAATEKFTVSDSDKTKFIRANGFSAEAIATIDPATFASEPSVKLVARLRSMQAHPGQSGEAAWLGMRQLSGQIKLPIFNIETSAAEAAEFNKARLALVERGLSTSPFVFISGLTGVGKSTFVDKYIANEKRKLYRTEESIEAWAKDNDPNVDEVVLFFDEANIGDKHWSRFEGLFNNPPGILIDGVFTPLSSKPKHKVIYAGNPLSYGDRVLPSLFERHGNAVLFEILPPSLIFEDILKPVLSHEKRDEVAVVILKAYQFMCEQSPHEILMTPRDLQMIALMTQNYLDKTTDQHIKAAEVAAYYTYQIIHPLVKPSFARDFYLQFKPKSDIANLATAKNVPASDYIMTESRKRLSTQLQDLLSLREWRQSKAQSPEQMYGGLGGIVIEGEPGIGKSELVIHTLRAAGYHQSDEPIQNPGKVYYSMPVSMPYQQKVDLLLKAFHEGAVVIVDEINSSPMMERLLNDLLMGKTSDGKRPAKPGFMLIGTQNPPTMAGRQVMSPALARRLIKAELGSYNKEEMKFILTNKGLQEEMIEPLVDAYLAARTDAMQNHVTPVTCFRDVTRFANKMIESKKKVKIADKKQEEIKPVEAAQASDAPILAESKRVEEKADESFQQADENLEAPEDKNKHESENKLEPPRHEDSVDKETILEETYHTTGLFKLNSPADEIIAPGKRLVMDAKRVDMIANLQKYVSRIESYRDKNNDIKFDYFKFPFYKQSRGKNRMANYLLAKYLIAELKVTDKPITELFREAHQLRKDIIQSDADLSVKDFKDRGINSAELKGIIKRGKKIS